MKTRVADDGRVRSITVDGAAARVLRGEIRPLPSVRAFVAAVAQRFDFEFAEHIWSNTAISYSFLFHRGGDVGIGSYEVHAARDLFDAAIAVASKAVEQYGSAGSTDLDIALYVVSGFFNDFCRGPVPIRDLERAADHARMLELIRLPGRGRGRRVTIPISHSWLMGAR